MRLSLVCLHFSGKQFYYKYITVVQINEVRLRLVQVVQGMTVMIAVLSEGRLVIIIISVMILCPERYLRVQLQA